MATNNPVIDAYNNRPDVQAMIKTKKGDVFTAGTEANTALNDWWNTAGQKETASSAYNPTPIDTKTINSNSLVSEPALKTLTPDDGMDYYNKVFNDQIAGYGDTQAQVEQNATDTKQTVGDINSLSDMLLGKTADTQAANETAGVNSERANNTNLTNQLNDTTAQINALARQAQAIPIQIQQQGEKRIMTDAGAAPLTASALRENALKALALGQQSDILNASLTNSTNKLADAKDKAQQIVDLKYKPIEDEITNLKNQLELNKEYITDPAEKKLADQQSAILDERTRLLTEKKDKEKEEAQQKIETTKSINQIALEAARNGASKDIIRAINESTDVAGAVAAAGNSLVSPNTQIVTLQDGNTVIVDTRTGNVIKNYGGAKPNTKVIENADGTFTTINTDTGNIVNITGGQGTVIIPQNTLAGKNNNPGNLRFVGQQGATQGVGGFARFETPEAGYQALIGQIQLDASRGLTVSQFVNKYAPPSENNTGLYITQFNNALGSNSSTLLSSLDVNRVAEFMAKKESGTVVKASNTSNVSSSEEGSISSYQVERARRTVQSVDNLLGKVSVFTTGYGSLLSGIPTTDARNFKAELETLKSNIAFSELTAMREASKTGGALGQVSDREGKLLESALGALDTGQSPENFKKNLQQIKDSINNWISASQSSSYNGIYLPGSVSTGGNIFNGISLPN
ncbi:MAG: hypothetical protein WCQ96_03115 [Patescibacteria group bacterium]